MKNSLLIKKLVGLAVLTALVVALQFLSNYVAFGPVSITLALIPMVVGAVLYGPLAGLFLGAVLGGIALAAPSTSLFLSFNPWFTTLLCLLKTGVAGFVSGWVYKGIVRINALKKAKFPTAIIAAALVAPCINTGLFILGTAFMFQGLSYLNDKGDLITLVPSTGFGAAFTGAASLVVFTNWIIEFSVSVVMAPSIVYLFKVFRMQFDLGFSNDFKLGADTVLNNNNNLDVEEALEV